MLAIKHNEKKEGGTKLTTKTGVILDIKAVIIMIGIIMVVIKTTIISQIIEMMVKIAKKIIMKIGNSHYLVTWFNQFILEHLSSTQFQTLLQPLHLLQLLQSYKPNLNLLLIVIKNNKRAKKTNKKNQKNNKIIPVVVLVLILLKIKKKKKNQWNHL